MFEVGQGQSVRRFAVVLALLSATSLVVTGWIHWDVTREQQIVERIIGHLPSSDLAAAQELSGDLRMQGGLSVLLALNTLVTVLALAVVIRGYLTSERSLRDVKVLAVDILASMDVGVLTTDMKGKVTSINPLGLELLGGSPRLVGTQLCNLPNEHAALNSLFEEVTREQHTIRDRDYQINAPGQQQVLRAGCALLCNQADQRIGTVLQLRNVTQRLLNEQRLRRMERFMGLGALAAGLQHEIRNPLAALSLHVQLLGERLHAISSDDETTELLDILQTELTRIKHVLDGFRNYASIQELGRAPTDVAVLISKLVRFLRPQTENQNVSVRFVASKCHQSIIDADVAQLEQVLLNLALNALDAMPDGGTLLFEIENRPKLLCIQVADTGSGIPIDIQPQVFDPYFTTRGEGTGMGLALCDKIVRQHGGSIDFQSNASGTRFTVSLPCKDSL